METKDTKIYSVAFLNDANIFRMVSGVKLEENETMEEFVTKRAIPRLRLEPQNDAEAMGGYRVCVGTEISVVDAQKELGIEDVKVEESKEVIKEIVVNEMNDPKAALKYFRDKYTKDKEEKALFNKVIKRIK